MSAVRDMRVDGEYDRPLPSRVDEPTKEDLECLRNLLQKYNMTDSEKIAVYETGIEDMLHAIQDRLDELNSLELDDFERGRQLAFMEMLDIIKTRYSIIYEVLN